jgi:hypothetical protein
MQQQPLRFDPRLSKHVDADNVKLSLGDKHAVDLNARAL